MDGSRRNQTVVPTCRFFSTSFAPKSSHFYTPYEAECLSIRGNANWQYEAIAFYLQLPDANASAPRVPFRYIGFTTMGKAGRKITDLQSIEQVATTCCR